MCYLTAPKHDYFMTMVLDIVSNICMYVCYCESWEIQEMG
jgi:hypothetical protein